MQLCSGRGEFRRFWVREFSRPAIPMRIRVWRRVAVAATTPTPTRGSTPGLFCSNEGIQLQLSGRQLAVLFEIQNPARSVLALLAGAALSTQAIDLQFHACGGVCWADQLLLLHSTPLHRPAPLVTHAGRRPRPCQCHAAGLIMRRPLAPCPRLAAAVLERDLVAEEEEKARTRTRDRKAAKGSCGWHAYNQRPNQEPEK